MVESVLAWASYLSIFFLDMFLKSSPPTFLTFNRLGIFGVFIFLVKNKSFLFFSDYSMLLCLLD